MQVFLLAVCFWRSRENSVHFRAVNLDGFGVDQDECDYCRNRAFVDPCVNRAALDQDNTGLQMHDLIVFEFAIKLTRQLNRVVPSGISEYSVHPPARRACDCRDSLRVPR
jgi:hypothetical protein